ncbi:hypothetical protein [Kribbella sp. NPDC048915]|uniref:hypothetical protein n=1 Tax=Kribbella sp. NPDC048915 TaxID=3155148 RepID=UPI0033FB061E
MDEHRSIELLARMIGRERVAAEPDAAAGLVRQCGGLPLAVKIAGARLIGRPDWTLAAFADRLSDERGRLDELRYGDLAVRASLAVGWQGLGGTADRLLRLIGSLAVDDLGLAAANALDGRAPAAVHRDLDRLVEARLLEPGAGDRYAVHDLVRLDARERSAQLPAAERHEAAERFVHFYLATLRDASRLYAPHSTWRWTTGLPPDRLRTRGLPGADRRQFIEWIRAESGNLVRVAQLAAAQSPATITAYALAAHVPVGSQGCWQERREICELAVETGEEADLAHVRRDLGLVYRHLGLQDKARVVLRQAVEAFRARGEQYLEADALVLLADGSDREAGFSHLQRARELARQVNEYRAEANALAAMAELLADGGDYREARRRLDQTLRLYLTHRSTTGIGRALGKLGELCQRFGHVEEAASYFADAADVSARVGMSLREAARAWDLADVLHDLGRFDEAREQRARSIELGVQLGAIAPDRAAELRAQSRPKRPATLRSDP